MIYSILCISYSNFCVWYIHIEDVKITLEVLFRLRTAPEISPCRSCSTTNIRGLFLEDSDPQEYHTHTQIGISVATLTWKWLWREQRYHEKVTNWYNTLFYNNARMCQPWLKVIFHHSWRPACSVLLRDELWDTFERSGVITCHYGSVQHQKTDTWQKTTLESAGYPTEN